jgi:hypothetical protein
MQLHFIRRRKLTILAAQFKNMIRSLLFIACLTLPILSELHAQPGIKAVFTTTPPVIDGLVNEEVWKNAPLINEFFQREPKVSMKTSQEQLDGNHVSGGY